MLALERGKFYFSADENVSASIAEETAEHRERGDVRRGERDRTCHRKQKAFVTFKQGLEHLT